MASGNSTKGILYLGGFGFVLLLALAWWLAASTSEYSTTAAKRFAEESSTDGIAALTQVEEVATEAAELAAEATEEATETMTAATEQVAEEVTETAAAATAEVAEAAAVATASMAGDPANGAKVFRKCKACHMVGDNAKNRVGPHLVGVVGRTIGSVEGFKYSAQFEEANAAGEVWTPEALDAFFKKPKDYYSGTKMAFAGLRKESDRADVIAYLAAE